MAERTTTVQVNEDGRCTIPVEIREALGFNGSETLVEITVKYDD